MRIDLYEARKFVSYDPKTGFIKWVIASGKCKAGDVVGSAHSKGYREASINNKRVFLHRLAWLLFYGEAPQGHIDHINGDRSDNRICNLRIASCQQNSANMKKRGSNKSGLKGVYFHKKNKKWIAGICVDYKSKYLGSFYTKKEAQSAYAKAAHAAFGQYARID